MALTHLRARSDELAQHWGHQVLRLAAALLWLSNVSWKVPPDFGKTARGCRGLCAYVSAGANHPVLPGSAWFFEHIAAPNLSVFGWITLVSEAALAAALLSGRFVRVAALVGIAQSFGIFLAVANADHEWYWSYLLMMALHVALLATVRDTRPPSARAMAVLAMAYGAVVAVAHAGAGFGGDGNRKWNLFGARNDVPGDFGRNVFPGSIALGLVLVATGVVAAVLVHRFDERRVRLAGWGIAAVSAAALLTYGRDGLLIGLGSRASTAAVVAALALAMAVGPRRARTSGG